MSQEAKLRAALLLWLMDGRKIKEILAKVKRTERGWAAHFCGASQCRYHRNTLLEYEDKKVVISTVGRWLPNKNYKEFETIGLDRYFETMAFIGRELEPHYIDADVKQKVCFDSNWSLPQPDMENEADEMHEKVVAEITMDLINDTLRIESYG